MDTNQPGAATEAQLPAQQAATTEQLPQQQTTQSASQVPATSAVTPNPELAALQAELEKTRKIAHDNQAAFTKAQQERAQYQQQLQAVMGLQPQSDPIAPYLKDYTDRGFTGEDARFLAERDYKTDQRFQTLQSSLQAQNQVPSIMQQIYTNYPGLCANAQAVQEMQQALQQAAAAGRAELVNPEYAVAIGFQADGRMRYAQQQQPGAAPVQRPAAPNFNSMTGITTNFSGPQQQPQTNQIPAHLKAARDAELAQVRQAHNLPTPQQ